MSGNVQRPGGEHVIGNPTGMPHNKNVEPWDCLSCNPSGWPKERWINNEQRRQSYNTETQRSRTSPVPSVDDEQPDTDRLVALYAKTIDGLRAEVFRAVQVIPNEFLASDPWENGVQRMADEINRLRAADAHRVQPQPDERLNLACHLIDRLVREIDDLGWTEIAAHTVQQMRDALASDLAASPATEAEAES